MKQVLGKVEKEIIEKYNVPKEHLNKKIVLYPNDKRHCKNRHLKNFDSAEQFYYVMSNLEYIIEEPDLVYYNEKKATIEYYRELGKDISIRIRVDLGNELRMKTMFPVEKDKLEDREQKLLIEKYSKKEKVTE